MKEKRKMEIIDNVRDGANSKDTQAAVGEGWWLRSDG
jgi:hypothetical protein